LAHAQPVIQVNEFPSGGFDGTPSIVKPEQGEAYLAQNDIVQPSGPQFMFIRLGPPP